MTFRLPSYLGRRIQIRRRREVLDCAWEGGNQTRSAIFLTPRSGRTAAAGAAGGPPAVGGVTPAT